MINRCKFDRFSIDTTLPEFINDAHVVVDGTNDKKHIYAKTASNALKYSGEKATILEIKQEHCPFSISSIYVYKCLVCNEIVYFEEAGLKKYKEPQDNSDVTEEKVRRWHY